ncbi:MAG TPA: VWA domain-containing protein, partial [Lacipirellulaceae bacterium]|nr:VWA domain-containing protein [Lacipirellulaceae bacterium]
MDSLFRNTLGPAAWTLVALVPPALFALYFLRLRREPVEVPSTYLWTKVIEDLHVNSLWQKLRRSLLLLLQLLLAGLAILALLRPGWQGDALAGRRFIFLVDRSASMSTTDVAGRSRLDAAKSRVGELIDQLDSDMAAMIIAFDDRADVVQEFTGNRRQLREALERVTPSAAPTNIRTALELAAGFTTPSAPAGAGGASVPAASDAAPANGGADSGAPGGTPAAPTAVAVEGADPIELYILSDGRFGAVEEFALGKLRPKYLPLGETTTSNLAITSFNTRRNDLRPTQRQAFVQVANYSDEPQTAAVSLLLDGKLRDAAEVAIPAGDVAGATFNLGDIGSGKLEARLTPPAEFVDPLELDNRAYAVLDRPKLAQVLMVTPGNRALELGLSTARVRRFANVKKVAPDVLA